MNPYIPDYHTHTRFSCDGEATMEVMCRAALAQGMTEVAITDHADFESLDPCYGYFRPEAYWRALERCRATFGPSLTIRAGVECGESHIYQEEITDLLARHPYDVVLGSLHWAQDRPAFHSDFFLGLDLDEGLEIYFEELEQLAARADYDVLAHLDIIRRAAFYRFGLQELDLEPHETRVRRVLRCVAERGRALEMNTSTVRKGMGGPGPSLQVLRWFREEGGQFVTIGSDGHAPPDVGADFDQAWDMVRAAGFEGVTTFEGRVPHVNGG
jgi:histidinol-phosphatase (PHP family)